MARRVRDRHCRKLKLDSGYPRKILSSERGKGDDGQTLCAYGRGKNSASGTTLPPTHKTTFRTFTMMTDSFPTCMATKYSCIAKTAPTSSDSILLFMSALSVLFDEAPLLPATFYPVIGTSPPTCSPLCYSEYLSSSRRL
jgi:hypothetical protein